jgi:hypothetical protein
MLNSPLEIEIDMKPNIGDVYRVAFDSANHELNDILGAFEDLRARKERIEKVVTALKPLLGAEEAAAAVAAMQSASQTKPPTRLRRSRATNTRVRMALHRVIHLPAV